MDLGIGAMDDACRRAVVESRGAVPDCGEAVWTTEGLWVTNARMEYDTETRKDDCFDRERRPRVI